jgi:hypothetical protein
VGLSEGVELTWLRTLDERHVSVIPEAVNGGLHLLAILTNSAEAHMDQVRPLPLCSCSGASPSLWALV